MPHGLGKKVKICGFVKQLKDKSKEAFDETIVLDDFVKYAKDKKAIKKLANKYDYFVAQADLMAKVASTFGRVLGPKGKMPNPKSGCVVPAVIPSLKPLAEKLQNTVKLQTRNELAVKVGIGKESMKDEDIEANIEIVYNTVLKIMPHEKNNVRQVILKLTMGKPYVIGKGFIEHKKVERDKTSVKEKPKVEVKEKIKKKPKEKLKK